MAYKIEILCYFACYVYVYLYSSELNLMVEIFNHSSQLKPFAGKVKQGDTLEDFKKIAERNGITVCAPGTSKLQHYISYVYMLWLKFAFG